MISQKTMICLILFLMIGSSRIIAGGSSAGANSPLSNSNAAPGNGTNAALTVSNKAYGDNMREVEPGVFAIYSGDVNQDGFVTTEDVGLIDNDNLSFEFGYIVTDINGDGFVTTEDVGLADNNNLAFVGIQRP